MIVLTQRTEDGNASAAVKAALLRIQRATRIEPEVLAHQPGAWLVSWPAIATVWAIAALIAAGRFSGFIQ